MSGSIAAKSSSERCLTRDEPRVTDRGLFARWRRWGNSMNTWWVVMMTAWLRLRTIGERKREPVPKRDSVYDLANRTPEELWQRVRQTLAGRPFLQTVFTDEAIALYIKRRNRGDSTLLLRLVLTEDEGTRRYWDEIEAHLVVLGAEAIKFAEPMRNSDAVRHEGWRTELWFAAWIHRHTGAAIDVEPTVGTAKAEFRALLIPELWFEVKSPKDAPETLAFAPIDDRFRRLMNDLPERFRVDMEYTDDYKPIHVNEVALIVKRLRRTLSSTITDDAPITFRSHGIDFTAFASDAQTGSIGIVSGPLANTDEYESIAFEHIREAAKKLPPQHAGIVVIDRTNTEWMDDRHVQAACFGWNEIVSGDFGDTYRWCEGIFRSDMHTRISAVISYSRRYVNHGLRSGYDLLVIPNPHARTPLLQGFLGFPGVREMVLHQTSDRWTYTIEEH